jgi:hypothetical protein
MTQAPYSNDKEKLRRASDYPLGTLESRAAARAACERRERILDGSAVVVIMTRLPRMFGQQAPVVIPPDSLSRYKMPDGSTVDVIRRYWGEPNIRGVTIFVEQRWHDGVYHGDNLVKSLEEVRRVGSPMRQEVAGANES